MSDPDQTVMDAAALAAQRIEKIGPLRVPDGPYKPTKADLKTFATMASVMALADAMGRTMAEREKALRLRLSTAERRIAELEKRLAGT